MDKGIFGNLFDFNGDGKLDAAEQGADFLAFEEMIRQSEESADDNFNDSDGFISDDDDLASDEDNSDI